MKLTSEIIQQNLSTLDKAKNAFPILKDYSDASSLKTSRWIQGSLADEYWKNEDNMRLMRDEIRTYKLSIYSDFIDFIEDCKRSNQEIFYRNKIKNADLQRILVTYAIDEEAKMCFKSKTKATFTKLINSKRWNLLSGSSRPYRSRAKRLNDNLSKSCAIIANYCIQNQIEISDENSGRIKNWFTKQLPEPDLSISKEIERTSSIIDFIVTKLGENDSDFRKSNIDHLTMSIKNELSKKILSLQKLEKIRCLELAQDQSTELTENKTYEVKDTRIESGVLKVEILNDKGTLKYYFYRNFETVSNLREDFISSILDEF